MSSDLATSTAGCAQLVGLSECKIVKRMVHDAGWREYRKEMAGEGEEIQSKVAEDSLSERVRHERRCAGLHRGRKS